jgi:hypothetical protein
MSAMPPVLSSLQLQDFFGTGWVQKAQIGPLQFSKSIQHAFRFFVSFIPDALPSPAKLELYKRIGFPPIIRSWHVTDIDIPSYEFKAEQHDYGPLSRNLPVMEMDGFKVKIGFEEDQNGTIAYFINWLIRSMIDRSGLYTPPDICKIPVMIVLTEDELGLPISFYTIHDLFFLSHDGPNLGYDKSESVKYSITFSADRINSFQPKAYGIAQAGGLATQAVRNLF